MNSFIFTNEFGLMEQVKVFLNGRMDVVNWVVTACPNTILITLKDNGVNLFQAIAANYPSKQFILTQIAPFSTNGWQPKIVWEHLNNPKAIRWS
jgi:hypothetical protein